MDWKSDIFCQLKDHKRQSNVCNDIIAHYNRLLENNSVLQTQCIKLRNDVEHLRLANAGLEKASKASEESANVNNKLTVVTEEVMTHLREKGELVREVLRLNHALTEVNEKLTNEELTVQQYRTENELLTKKIDKSECDVNDLLQSNQILHDELSAVKNQLDQLTVEYNQMKPIFFGFQQQLDVEKRINKQLEEQLMESKKIQLEMLDAEVERYDKKKNQPSRRSDTIADDRSSISSGHRPSDPSSLSTDADGHFPRERGLTETGASGGNLFSSFRRLFVPGITNMTNDSFNRTPKYCLSASIPTREINHWDCTELEVYALQFQPSGSLLATGGSDKMIHLWEISSSGQRHQYYSLQGSHGAINALDFDKEGARLLAGCSNNKVYIWSYADTRMLKDIYAGHTAHIYTCKFISGTKLATGSADRYIKIWDLQNRQCIRDLPAGSKCHDLVVTDAAGTIISGHFDKKIRVWDTYTDKCRSELLYNASITSLSYNAEKQQLLACLKDDTLKLIDLRQNKVIYTFSHDQFQISNDTTKAILSPDGRYACVGSQDGSLFVWNTTNGICENVLARVHSTMITAVAWHPEGRYVASCEKHRRVILWSD